MLEAAIRDGARSLVWETDGFAYADDHDGQRYVGLRAGQEITAVAPSGLVVMSSAAAEQWSKEQAASAKAVPGTGPGAEAGAGAGTEPDLETGTGPGTGAAPGAGAGAPGSPSGVDEQGATGTAPPGPTLPTRYYGRVKLDSARWAKTAADVAEAIVSQLERTDGAKLSITIEVEAESPQGFDDRVQRTVTENATTLKFNTTEFEN